MGEVIDLDSRRRRPTSLTRRRRPTVAQAEREYPGMFVGQLVITQSAQTGEWGKVAHRAAAEYQGRAATPCGHGGQSKTAPPDTPVCLRCYPWWHA